MILTGYHREDCDVLVALHAIKSASSIERFAAEHSDRPIILAITGTDIHLDPAATDYNHFREVARKSAAIAARVVFLREPMPDERDWLLDPTTWDKYRVIFQSASAPRHRRPPRPGVFEVCVLGHLRAVKDPFRAADAARLLPPESRVRILHIGAALTPDMEVRAWQELAENNRYRWYGELPRNEALTMLSGCRLLAMTSISEGGPSAVSEALACGIPVISTRIDGVLGLLGEGYPGYFPVGDTQELARLLAQCESDTEFLHELQTWCDRCRHLVQPTREVECWRTLLDDLLQ